MSEVDARIVLGGQPADPAGAVGQMMSLKSMAQKLRMDQATLQSRNQLQSILSNPNAYDPKSGRIVPAAMQAVMAADYETGIKLREDDVTQQLKAAQDEHYKTEQGKARWDYMSTAAGIGYDSYDAAQKSGKSEAEAQQAGLAARNEAISNNGGQLGEDDVKSVLSTPFDPTKARVFALTNPDYSKRMHEEAMEKERATHDENLAKIAAGRQDTSAESHWQILTDPTQKDSGGNPIQYRYNPVTAQSSTLTGQPFTPSGAAKLAAATTVQPLSDNTANYWADRVRREGPSVLSVFGLGRNDPRRAQVADLVAKKAQEDGAGAGGDVAAKASLHADSASLVQVQKMADLTEVAEGRMTANFNTAMKLAKTAGNKDTAPFFEKWVQAGEVALGDEDIPPYQLALLTAANEAAKISEGSFGIAGASVQAREEMYKKIAPYLKTNTLEKIGDVLTLDAENAKKGYATQRANIEGRIKNVVPSESEKKDKPDTKAALPPEAAAKLEEGKNTTFGNGQIWTLKDGKPVQVK